MKKSLRLICLVLAIALSVACLAGCGDETTSSATSSAQQNTSSMTATEELQAYDDNQLPDYDLGGVTLLVASGTEDILFPDEEKNELSARRKAWIDECKQKYNFELEYVYYDDMNMTGALQTDLISGEYVADFALPVIRQAGPFIQNKLCYDLTGPDFSQYLDFTKPWWDDTMVKASTVGGGTYCCTPQFTSAANTTWVCFFNRNMMEELGYNPDDMYTLQETGKWTWDKFREMCKKAKKDLDGNNNYDANDRWGFVSARWHIFNNLVTVAGIDYVVERDENGDGKNEFVFNLKDNTEAITALSTMNEIFVTDQIYWAAEAGPTENGANPGMLNMFAQDKALFMLYSVDACQRETIREMESDFGMVLTPKYNEESEYISRAEQTTKCLFVPVTAQYKLETAFAVQALAYSSWKGVEDIMELNFAQYVRDDGSEYCIYEVFNHTTFTIDQLLFAVGTDGTWLDIINPNLCDPVTKTPSANISGAIMTIQDKAQLLLDNFYNKATEENK